MIKLFVGNQEISELTDNVIQSNLPDPNEYEYYLRKGKNLYFRNYYGKVSVNLLDFDMPDDVKKQFKYGHKFILKFDTDKQ